MLNRKKTGHQFTLIMFIALMLPFISAYSQNNNDTIVLTFESAKEMALEQNPTIRASRLEARAAQYQLDESRGNLLPHFNISGSYTKNIKRPVMFLPEDFTGVPGGEYVEVGTAHNYRATLQGSVPLFSPAAYANIKANRVGIELAEEEHRGSKIDLAYDVQQAFFNALLAKESMEVIKLSYESALENLLRTQQMYAQGLVSEYDKIRAEVETENIEPEVMEMENSYEMAINNLKTVIGIDESQPVNIEGDLMEATQTHIAQFEIIEPGRNLVNNPDLTQMRLNKVMMEKQSDAIMATALPSINAVGNYNYQTDAEDLRISDYRWVETFSAGLQVNIPLFQGFTVKNRAKQIDVATKQIDLQREYLEDNLQIQLDNILKRLNVAIEKSNKAEKNVMLAERGHKIAKTRYDSGQGTLLEVNDSELALTRARFNLVQAKYDILMAIIEYDKFVGKEF